MSSDAILAEAGALVIPWAGPIVSEDASWGGNTWLSESREVKGRYGRDRRRLRIVVKDYSGQPADRWECRLSCGDRDLMLAVDDVSREHAWAMAEAHLRLRLLMWKSRP